MTTKISRAVTHLALVILSLPAILPLIWMLSTSLKADDKVYAGTVTGGFQLSSLIPNPVMWSNYPRALETVPFNIYLRNTLFLGIVCVIGAVLSSALVAYGFGRLDFRGKKVLFAMLIATMALPSQVTMIPVFELFRSLGWYGTYLPLIVPCFTSAPFYVFLLTQFFKTIPEEIAESARLDGANEFQIFSRIIIHLAKPALATCALFQFLGTWNDFMGPLIYINDPSRYTLAYGLQQFMSAYGGQWTQLMAASVVFTLPIILLFFFAQKTFIQGISTTGGK
jgi:multiple sugar transport system permease protein